MSDYDKKNDLLKELEIQSILDERNRIADQEQMKKNAQKYRAKPKIQEIFSNADKKPRLKNENPLELDSENKKKPDVSNTIVGEKTAATMKAEPTRIWPSSQASWLRCAISGRIALCA